ncbi:unnamed protein product [Clonostachys rosea]|uniref:Carboxypeptidase n=1 Tax=Bionectria ochroleuca TaxID=29856 RepID=A0ABY6TYD9_BIOOC|nr:unnamed protein product [Clonostachys rosea]
MVTLGLIGILLASYVPLVHSLAINPRQVPAAAEGVKTITSPAGVTLRYKEPGKDGICETTSGVNSYSGYIDIAPDVHVFFWFFESRNDPANDPVTLWLNGGPGSDSLIGLFEEIGPCQVVENGTTVLRDHSWTELSNVLFLSQPVGTGFSYSEKGEGYLDPTYLIVDEKPGDETEKEGRWSLFDPTKEDTSRLAAITCWEVLQGFYSNLPQLSASNISSTDFHLWFVHELLYEVDLLIWINDRAESFGGHWGPAFMKYFSEQNDKLAAGTTEGRKLNMRTLGIVNGIVDEQVQTQYQIKYTRGELNGYGIDLVNETMYEYGRTNLDRPDGCQQHLNYCASLDRDSLVRRSQCSAAQFVCQSDVEGIYYTFKTENRGVYDIRYEAGKDVPPDFWRPWLNTGPVQNSLGVDLNYTSANLLYSAFSLSGDFAAGYLSDIDELLKSDIHVALVYGDADYICNWLGGEALSTAAEWSGAETFKSAGYTDIIVGGDAYGEVRQYERLSFSRVWDAGHEVPYWQPSAAFQIFNRTLNRLDIATGKIKLDENSSYKTNGTAKTTHTTTLSPLPAQT